MNTYSDCSDLFFLLKQADLQITQLFETHMGVSLTRYTLLRQLCKEDGVSQRMLQEQLRIDQAAVTRHLKILEEKGSITRMRNPSNNREVLVFLTPQGKQLLQGCRASKEQLLAPLFEGYPPDQLDALMKLLRDVTDRAATVSTTIETGKE